MVNIIDDAIVTDILSINLPMFTIGRDKPSWVLSPDGMCTASSAYDFLNKEDHDIKGWKWFWKLQLPQKLKTFIWLILHDKLPTNLLRNRRGMATSDLCPRCNSSSESTIHLFRDCPKAMSIWDSIPLGRLMRGRIVSTTTDWFSYNLKRKKILLIERLIPWNTLFCTTIWQI